MSDKDYVSRRRVLKTTGGIAGAGALSGCLHTAGEGGDDDGSSDGSGDDGNTEDGSSDDGSMEELSGDIAIAGSSTVFPLMTAVAEEYQRENSDVNIDISSTGSGGGFSNFFCVGDTDFNNASRPIKPEEQDLCEENGVEWVEIVAATDALTVVVNNDTDFLGDPPTLTVEELAQIWEEGAAETWSDVNSDWPDEEIDRYGAADTSGTYDYFIENVQGTDRGHTDDYQATEQDDTIATGVQGSEYAIGYFGFAYYFQNPDQVQAVAIDNGNGGVLPSLDTAASGEYQSLSRDLYTYPSISSLAEDHVADFARYFVEQTTNEEIVAQRVGYVPATEEKQQDQMEKLEDAIERAQSM